MRKVAVLAQADGSVRDRIHIDNTNTKVSNSRGVNQSS